MASQELLLDLLLLLQDLLDLLLLDLLDLLLLNLLDLLNLLLLLLDQLDLWNQRSLLGLRKGMKGLR